MPPWAIWCWWTNPGPQVGVTEVTQCKTLTVVISSPSLCPGTKWRVANKTIHSVRWYAVFRKVWQFLKKLNRHLSWDPVILQPPKKLKHMSIQRLASSKWLQQHYSQWPKTGNSPQGLSINWWMCKRDMVHSYNGISCGHQKEWCTEWYMLQHGWTSKTLRWMK